jgi:hypothetical protein
MQDTSCTVSVDGGTSHKAVPREATTGHPQNRGQCLLVVSCIPARHHPIFGRRAGDQA